MTKNNIKPVIIKQMGSPVFYITFWISMMAAISAVDTTTKAILAICGFIQIYLMSKAIKFEQKQLKDKQNLYKQLSHALKTPDQIADDMLKQVFKNDR